MDDLSNMLQSLLSDPGTMDRLQGLLAGFGGTPAPATPATPETESPPPPPPPPVPPPAPPAAPAPAAGLLGSGFPDTAMLGRLLPLLGGLQKENENTALLRALRPYLHGEREKRLDGAIQMMRLAEMLPLLQGGAGVSSSDR